MTDLKAIRLVDTKTSLEVRRQEAICKAKAEPELTLFEERFFYFSNTPCLGCHVYPTLYRTGRRWRVICPCNRTPEWQLSRARAVHVYRLTQALLGK
jgi:hypothetical protein